jgi:hypothetical protein
MAVTAPDWLTRHGGTLRPGYDARSWAVLFDGEPQYLLIPKPAGGKFTCEVMQTINGRRLDSGGIYPTADDAVRGGLEDLRKTLGW